jgi:hypothetical protein
MHGVNLDLLQTTPHRADGTARDPHAHHRAAHLGALRAARRARWRAACHSALLQVVKHLARLKPSLLARRFAA